jgi:hypothetical protein
MAYPLAAAVVEQTSKTTAATAAGRLFLELGPLEAAVVVTLTRALLEAAARVVVAVEQVSAAAALGAKAATAATAQTNLTAVAAVAAVRVPLEGTRRLASVLAQPGVLAA